MVEEQAGLLQDSVQDGARCRQQERPHHAEPAGRFPHQQANQQRPYRTTHRSELDHQTGVHTWLLRMPSFSKVRRMMLPYSANCGVSRTDKARGLAKSMPSTRAIRPGRRSITTTLSPRKIASVMLCVMKIVVLLVF